MWGLDLTLEGTERSWNSFLFVSTPDQRRAPVTRLGGSEELSLPYTFPSCGFKLPI